MAAVGGVGGGNSRANCHSDFVVSVVRRSDSYLGPIIIAERY